jgi:amidase
MARFAEYTQYDALGLAELVQKGEISAQELLQEAQARADQHNPQLNAIVARLDHVAEGALQAGLPDGPFRGVPFLLKDLSNALAGEVRTSGSRYFRDFVPAQDSELVRRYKAAGVTIFGKSNTPEFGTMPITDPDYLGSARNPWNTEHTPGGSSGGAGAAVAAGIVPMANGGDGGGSIRIPASCCGLVGLKPTRARTPCGPEVPEHWFGMSIEHVLSRSVRDSAAMLDATCAPEEGAPYAAPPVPQGGFLQGLQTPVKKLRIAYTTADWLGRGLDPECIEGVNNTAKLLQGLGHEVEEADPGVNREEFIYAMGTITSAETSAMMQAAAQSTGRKLTRADFEPHNWAMYKLGQAFTAAELQWGVATMRRVGQHMAQFMRNYDVLLTSTLGMPPVPCGALKAKGMEKLMLNLINALPLGRIATQRDLLIQNYAPIFDWIPTTPIANASGAPSLSLPLHWSSNNLPVGMMFTGRFGDDLTLLQLASQLEQAQPWFDKRAAGY